MKQYITEDERSKFEESIFSYIELIKDRIRIANHRIRKLKNDNLKIDRLKKGDNVEIYSMDFHTILLRIKLQKINYLESLYNKKGRLSQIKGSNPNLIEKRNEIDRLITSYEEDIANMEEHPDEYLEGLAYTNYEDFIDDPKVKIEIKKLLSSIEDNQILIKKALHRLKKVNDAFEQGKQIDKKVLNFDNQSEKNYK